MDEQAAIALGRVADDIGGIWEYDADHGDWQPAMPDGTLGEPESWTKVNGNYGPAWPTKLVGDVQTGLVREVANKARRNEHR